jgi:N-acyl-D-aspartate/D-glutamate deacylase
MVFDPDCIGPAPIHKVADLPGGASRLYAGAHGMHHVVVNGRPIVRDGALTGDAPGTLLRAGRDTYTVEAGTFVP